MVALGQLIGNPTLGLSLLSGDQLAGVEIDWAHVSELLDPTEFLVGGELLLFTGVSLPDEALAQIAYVERLVASGVAALGFGVGLSRSEVPEPLVDACRRLRLPLLAVPRRTPFLAITKAVSRAAAEKERTARELVIRAQSRLTAKAVGQDGVRGVLTEVHQLSGGWGIVLDRSGEVVCAAPPTAARRQASLAPHIERLRHSGGPASLTTQHEQDNIWLQSLVVGRTTIGFLALGRADPLSAAERQVVNIAVPLLVLSLNRSRDAELDRRMLQSSALALLLGGPSDRVTQTAERLWNGLPGSPVRMVEARGAPDSLEIVYDRLESEPRSQAAPAVYGYDDTSLLLMLPAEERVVGRVLAQFEGLADLHIGVSTPTGYDGLGTAREEAAHAASYAQGEQVAVAWFGQLPQLALLTLVEAQAGQRFAESLLGPLEAPRGDLVESLRVWLTHHGQWDPAAVELGVHRHTLRARMTRVQELLGRRLDSVDVRAELWMALQLRENVSRQRPGRPPA